MKKPLILLSLLFAGAAFAEQNMRDYVCIVREAFSDETKEWLSKTADYLVANGLSPYGRAVRRLDGSTFGSGFVYVADGDDVLTAGFPGLAGEPSWQLGTGSVTNASARIKDLIDPAVSLLIQHSAPVDAGNSGGPLLRRKSGGYEVVGINTWKVNLRQSTNLSLPASTAQKFIQQSLAGKNKKGLEARKALFNEILNAEDEDRKASSMERFVSKELAMSYGAAALSKTLRTAKTADCAYVVSSFEQSPIYGLTAAVAVQIFNKKEKIFNWKEESAADGGEFCVQSITEPVVEKAAKQKKKKKGAAAKKAKGGAN